MQDEKRARAELPRELQRLRQQVREYEAAIRESLRREEIPGMEGERAGEDHVPTGKTLHATGADSAPLPSHKAPPETPGHERGTLSATTADELREYGKFLEELVEDRTLQVMMANERMQNEIAERMLVEEELRARNAELEAFAHTISHDLRSSISVIEGYAQVARESSGELLRECLEKILYLTRRMESFIESLLAYSEAGRPEGRPEAVNPNRLLKEILAEREAEISAGNVEVIVEEELPIVRVDPLRLQQVFINLLDNALKYAGDNPSPSVRFGEVEREGAAVFYVRDNGIGIARKEQGRIFEPFQRLSSEKHHGLGIGLSTVKRAVEGWGGEVWVKSTPGDGSTFFFSIPVGGTNTSRK